MSIHSGKRQGHKARSGMFQAVVDDTILKRTGSRVGIGNHRNRIASRQRTLGNVQSTEGSVNVIVGSLGVRIQRIGKRIE